MSRVDSSVFYRLGDTMETFAGWIRERTPTWTDEQRYRLLSSLHVYGPPVSIGLFVFVDAPLLRVLGLCLVVFTLASEVLLRECILTLLEQEFSTTTWDDAMSKAVKAMGWTITRSEKMMFNIGLNAGVLLMMVLVLLRQSLIWTFPILVLLSLVLFSRGLLSAGSVESPPAHTSSPETPPSAQTPPPAVA